MHTYRLSFDAASTPAFLVSFPPLLPIDLFDSIVYTMIEASLAGISCCARCFRAAEADVERIAKQALGARATLVRVLPRSATAVRPIKGAAAAATDEVTIRQRFRRVCTQKWEL